MINRRALLWYLGLSFGLSWPLFLLPLAFIGLGEQTVTLIRVVAWALAMWGPGAAALIVTLVILKEPFGTLGLKRFGKFRYYLAAWFIPPLLVAAVIPLSLLIGTAEYDANMTILQQMVAQMPSGSGMTVTILLIAQLAQGLVLGPALNIFFTLGEELGWRGFLLPRLMPLGQWQAIGLSGLIWGLWHAPAVAQGLNYPGYPLPGILAMVVFCVLLGALFSWLALAGGSTWVAGFAHGSINAWGGLPVIFLLSGYSPLLGGTIASTSGWLVLGLFLLLLVFLRALPVRLDAAPPAA